MNPKHSIDFCPICGGGLCGIRICGLSEDGTSVIPIRGTDTPHGLVVCDECEAIWLEPSVASDHQYPDAEDAKCPICNDSLWGKNSRWANREEIDALGWSAAVNPNLDVRPDEGVA